MGKGNTRLRREKKLLARRLRREGVALPDEGAEVSLAANANPEGRVPLWSWPDFSALDELCRKQALALCDLPMSVHAALMPDAHAGVGMPIGGVLATDGAVVPGAVGVDIGCGVTAVRTTLEAAEVREHIDSVLGAMYRTIPVGQPRRSDDGNRGVHARRQGSRILAEWLEAGPFPGISAAGAREDAELADHQVGTLGGGNHFASIEADHAGRAWLLLHSGSRRFGKSICDRYAAAARAQCAAAGVKLQARELAFLELGTPLGDGYMTEMTFAMRFAEENHERMLERMRESVAAHVGHYGEDLTVRTHHNFAALEEHLGQRLVVHRKGAVKAYDRRRQEAQIVVIPGSMQAGSYIAEGRTSDLALDSCAHGAGRLLSRTQARKATSSTDIVREMAALGMPVRCPPSADVRDESGRAYKDIGEVMRRQADLVRPLYRLMPLGTLKG